MAKKKKTQEKWIQGAIKKPGALTAQAKRKGMTAQEFAGEVLANPEDYSPTTRKRARLAKTLKKIGKKRKLRG